MTADELVPVMVPRRHLSHVYGFIAKLDEGGLAPTAVLLPHANGQEASADDWTPSRLRKMLQQSPPAMKDILRAMAKQPDKWLTTKQLAEAIQNNPDADAMTVAGTLGAFGRRLKSRYGIDSFPFEKRYDHEAMSKAYCMSAAIGSQVLQMLQEV